MWITPGFVPDAVQNWRETALNLGAAVQCLEALVCYQAA